jgi:hypothetical protein
LFLCLTIVYAEKVSGGHIELRLNPLRSFLYKKLRIFSLAMSVPTTGLNLIRIANLRVDLEALHLQTFSLEQKFCSFEEWYRDALAAIRELEEQMPSSYFPAQDSRQVSSAFEEFQDLVESLDDAPYQQAPEPKKRQKPRSSQPCAILPRPSLLMPIPSTPLPSPAGDADNSADHARQSRIAPNCAARTAHLSQPTVRNLILPVLPAEHGNSGPENPLRRISLAEAIMALHFPNLHCSFEN